MTRRSITDTPATCPFTVLVDKQEKLAYTFSGLRAACVPGSPLVVVPTMSVTLPVGDYGILGHSQIIIERKSKADLYGSVSRRANFVDRLERLSERCSCPRSDGSIRPGYAAMVVEAEYRDLIDNPPPFSELRPKSLSRTLIAWGMRYPVRWWFLRDRDTAEVMTFRLLERWWIDRVMGQENQDLDTVDQGVINDGDQVISGGVEA